MSHTRTATYPHWSIQGCESGKPPQQKQLSANTICTACLCITMNLKPWSARYHSMIHVLPSFMQWNHWSRVCARNRGKKVTSVGSIGWWEPPIWCQTFLLNRDKCFSLQNKREKKKSACCHIKLFLPGRKPAHTTLSTGLEWCQRTGDIQKIKYKPKV